MLRKVHRLSAIAILIFATFHLANQLSAWFGIDTHTQVLNTLRKIYRIPAIEYPLLLAFLLQAITGIYLIIKRKAKDRLSTVQALSGAYLAFFFTNHIGADLLARNALDLDTNFYFGAAGLAVWPFPLFFAPYYALAVTAVLTHVGSIQLRSRRAEINGAANYRQTPLAKWTFAGALLGTIIVIGMSGLIHPFVFPADYQAALLKIGIR